MNNQILNITFFITIFLFIIILIFQLTMYNYKQHRKYSFRNELPFELVQGIDESFSHYHFILLFIVTLAQIVFAFNYVPQLVNWYDYLLVGGLALSSIMFYLLFFIKVFEVKKHIIVVLLQALSVITSFFAFGVYTHIGLYGLQNVGLAIVAYIIAAVALLALFNPKLGKWPIMEKVLQQDGTVLILRPRYFLLAIYEWSFIVLQFILLIFMYVALYL